MTSEKYRHIFLAGYKQTHGYTSPKAGGRDYQLLARERSSHSQRLKKQLEQAWKNEEQRQAVIHSDRKGAYIEF